MAVAESAQSLLGGGFAPRPRLFTPVDLGGGMTAADRYRHMMQVVNESNQAEKMLAESSQIENSYLKAERQNQAMRQESDVLAELNKLDPLSSDFERSAAQFTQFASLSPAVGRALDHKIQQRSGMTEALTHISGLGVEAGLDDEQISSHLSTATDLLRRGDVPGLQREMSLLGRLAKSGKERSELDVFQKQADIRLKSQKASNTDYIAKREVADAKNRRAKAYQSFQEKISEHRAKLPQSLKSSDRELLPGYTMGDFFKDPTVLPDSLNLGTDEFHFEDLESGRITRDDLLEAGVPEETVQIFESGQMDQPITVPKNMSVEEFVATQIVDDSIRNYVVGADNTPRIHGFKFLDEIVKGTDSDEAEAAVDELVAAMTSGALELTKDAFVAAFTHDRRGEEEADKARLENAEGEVSQADLFRATLDGFGFTPSTQAGRFAGGLYDSIKAANNIVEEKRKFQFVNPDFQKNLDSPQNDVIEDTSSGEDKSSEDWLMELQK